MDSLPNFVTRGAPLGATGARESPANNIQEKIAQFWLAEKGVQLFCNASAKLVTRVQTTNGFWLAENTKETTKNQSDESCFNNKI